ncbi:Uncharacterised protein [Raoultella planticola]|uniref:Uncharacterized protein n=1 Tax=Raoultella planticola TaxID=575 RepID=A0A485AJX3_RAOPL|nr:Uncharacterised protein [Raoultella planticola]
MAQTATVAIKEWRKNNKLICQIKLKYKKGLTKMAEKYLSQGESIRNIKSFVINMFAPD